MALTSIVGAPQTEPQKKHRVLIMEDNADLCFIYGKAVAQLGCVVDEANTVHAARRLLDQNRYDLFIADMRMGTENGLDVLRERGPQLEALGTNVVVVSAEEKYRRLTGELGIEYFLSKPVTLLSLTTLVKRLTAAQAS